MQRFRLENGLQILVVEDHSSPTFAYQTWFHVGSKNEKKGKTGLAHLFEHMMFKETTHLKDGEFDRLLEQAGAEGENAFTSRDFTAYVQEMPASQLDLIARLEADRMVNLKVDAHALKTETSVVQNERRFRNENSPDGTMYQEIFTLAFDKHPYHWPVIGYQEDLDSMTPDDALSFYRTFYSPNHATIIVAGDVNSTQVIDTIRKYYGKLKSQPEPERPSPDDIPITAPRTQVMKLNIQVQKLMMAYRIPGANNADRAALNVLRGVLTGGKSSRLARALINAGIVTDVDSFDLDDEHPTLLLIGANLQKGKTASQAEKVILQEIARLTREGPTHQELERVKNRMEMAYYERLDSNKERAEFLGLFETTTGDYRHGLELMDRVKAIQATDVKRVALQYLNPQTRIVITGVPQ